MSDLPMAVPSIVPMGEYTADIKGKVEERQSQFDPTKTYWEMPLIIQASTGEYFDFIYAFNPRNPIYHRLLELLGGEKQPTGFTMPPENYIGKKFKVKITERPAKNDKNRIVNEVIAVEVYSPKAEKVEKEAGEEKEADWKKEQSEDPIPF